MKNIIEQAKSGRSKCQICEELIEEGTLRLGIDMEDPYGNDYYPRRIITQWHHLKCAAKKKYAELTEAIKNYIGEIPDIKELEQLMIEKPVTLSNIEIDKDFKLLIESSENGDIETVKSLIEKDININLHDEHDGITALHNASSSGHLEIVKLIIEKGADVNAKSNFGTPLSYASGHGNLEIVRLLIENGADVNEQVSYFQTPLITASRMGHTEIVKLLLEKGAYINMKWGVGKSALIYAAKMGHFETVKILIEKGADVTAEELFTEEPVNALYYAYKGGFTDVMKLLIDAVIAKDKGRTALKQVVQYGRPEIVLQLINAGADFNTKVIKDKTLLTWAIDCGFTDIVNSIKAKTD